MPISDLSKEQLEKYAKDSDTWKDLMIKCGYTNFGCRYYLKKKLDLFDIDISHFKRAKNNRRFTDAEIFIENSEYSAMKCIKNKLLRTYKWEYKCSNCQLSEWMGQKIPIEIDHINGNHCDNRIENLRFLCPNCHALTDTYKGKNIKNKEHSKELYNQIDKKKICNKCGGAKHKNADLCKKCHITNKLHKNKIKSVNICINCKNNIQKGSQYCMDCYKKARKEGQLLEKPIIDKKGTKDCPDCNKIISIKSKRCRSCHYNLLKLKSNTINIIKEKGKCVDCNINIQSRATRCVPCSKNIVEKANKNLRNNCIDCKAEIYSTSTRCTNCYNNNSRKVVRPSYEQLLKDKKNLNMVQIGKKYGVSDNSIRKWIKHYEK